MGFVPSQADCCLFLKFGSTERVAVLLWVDDFIFMYEKEDTWSDFIQRLRQRFTIPSVGPLTSFLGMEISYQPEAKSMLISQANTIDILLNRARMADCHPVPFPCQSGAVFSKKDCPEFATPQATEFSSLVPGELLGLPDIAYVVNKLCKFMANSGEVTCNAQVFVISKEPEIKACCSNFQIQKPKYPKEFMAMLTHLTPIVRTPRKAHWPSFTAEPFFRGTASCTPMM